FCEPCGASTARQPFASSVAVSAVAAVVVSDEASLLDPPPQAGSASTAPTPASTASSRCTSRIIRKASLTLIQRRESARHERPADLDLVRVPGQRRCLVHAAL